MEKNLFRIDILGTSFTIQTDEKPEYLEQVVNYFSEKTETVQKSVSNKEPLKIAILAGILLVDELFKSQNRLEESSTEEVEAERIALKLIDVIDKSLKNT